MTATTTAKPNQPPMTSTLPIEAILDEVDRHNRELARTFGSRHHSWRKMAAKRRSQQAQDAWDALNTPGAA